MTAREIKRSIRFGKEVIESYKKNGEDVPAWVYEKVIRLYEKLMEKEATK